MEPNGQSSGERTSNGRKPTDCPARALSPLIGILVMIAVTVVLAAILTVGASALGTGGTPPTAGFDLSADAADSTIELEHAGGDAVDVRELAVRVEIDGVALENQPPVPFVGAEGFDETPTGPFNARSEPIWRAGESARVDLASTNDPRLRAGATVTVTLVTDDHRIATLETTAR
ncbi:type IV pilin [Halostagnicola kamekurae]|uniref:Flagellin N-terminal-like domain-containing protein n=1 Tax=Halostagnicola kamekurae TaxID=619731 RepID=A0A1I6PY39_9EURY|nr:type IV pilin N-terminal domain-containing protein [Halostagnicola kamekurae]SFS45129.1 flagellin N-terminal-like domain-containing protein [Halostagnicola kamekurae]